jgi:pimeloyl-ACP methyl ester carboxylesterase
MSISVPIPIKLEGAEPERVLDYSTHDAPSDVVFIHGAGGNNLVWKNVVDGLSGPRLAYAVNLPGHPSGPITCNSIDQYVDSVHGFIRESGLCGTSVCGHSMGGAVAQALAVKHPEDVGRLILISTGAKLGVRPDFLEALQKRPLDAIENMITPFSFYNFDLSAARNARPGLSLSNPGIFLNDYLACKQFDVRPKLRELSASSMIICGEQDRMTPPKWAHFLHDNIRPSTLFFIREAGHMVIFEKPASVSFLVQSFLSRINQ